MSHRVCWNRVCILLISTLTLSSPVWANTGGIPALATPIQLVTSTIGGPVLAALLTLAFIVCGLGIAFAQSHGYDRLGHLFIGAGVSIGGPAIVILLFAAIGAASPLIAPASSTLITLIMEDLATLSIHGVFAYMVWKGIRYGQQRTRRI